MPSRIALVPRKDAGSLPGFSSARPCRRRPWISIILQAWTGYLNLLPHSAQGRFAAFRKTLEGKIA